MGQAAMMTVCQRVTWLSLKCSSMLGNLDIPWIRTDSQQYTGMEAIFVGIKV